MEQRFAFRLKWRRIGLAIGFAALLFCWLGAALYLSSDDASPDDVLKYGGVLLFAFSVVIVLAGLRLRQGLKTLGVVIVNERGIRWESNGAVAWEGSWDALEVAFVDRERWTVWIRQLPNGELFAMAGVDTIGFADFEGLVDAIGRYTSVTGNLSKIEPVNRKPEVSDEALKAVCRLGWGVLLLAVVLGSVTLMMTGARFLHLWVFPLLVLIYGVEPVSILWKVRRNRAPLQSSFYGQSARRRTVRILLLITFTFGWLLHSFLKSAA